MNSSKVTCYQVFSALQYAPFIEKVINEKDKHEILKTTYTWAIPAISGMYEFKTHSGIKTDDEGKISIKVSKDDLNFLKINPERIEIQQILDDEFNFERFNEIFKNVKNIHKKLFNNQAIKFGLIKFYEIQDVDEPLVRIFNIDKEYIDILDNCRKFFLIKKDGFNINLEFFYSNNSLRLKVDINDIVQENVFFDWEHFDEILILHDKIVQEEVDKIFSGGSNE